jgi:HlyD family secretion protein
MLTRLLQYAIVFVILTGIGVGGAQLWRVYGGQPTGPTFRLANVERQSLTATIGASGPLQAEDVVDVGAQVAGRIVKLGCDYRSKVEPGDLLALIDDKIYTAQLRQSQADLEQELANQDRAKADIEQCNAKFLQAEKEWQRVERLTNKSAVAETESDLAYFNFLSSKAALAVAKATLRQSEAITKKARAAVEQAQITHDYTQIRSPVKGEIIDRRVNVGQTVVASLNAPSLFLIAKDLTKMQVWAAVNEADIGQIYLKQPVRFTVDSYPTSTFKGEVAQIRLNASMNQNVVTYTVIVSVNNDDGRLYPYMTANLQFEVSKREQVLTVPNAALRWQPSLAHIAPAYQPEIGKIRERKARLGSEPATGGQGTLWVRVEDGLKPLTVQVGLSDGVSTEVSGDELTENLPVVIGVATIPKAATNNPFAPPTLKK